MTWITCPMCHQVPCTCFRRPLTVEPLYVSAPVFYPDTRRIEELERRVAELEKKAAPKKRKKAEKEKTP